MKVRLVDYKKNSNRFVNLVLQTEYGQRLCFKDTSELTFFMDTKGKNFNGSTLEPVNFTLNPFKLTADVSSSDDSGRAGKRESALLAIKVDKLSEKVDTIIKSQERLGRCINSLNNRPYNTEDVSNRLDLVLREQGVLSTRLENLTIDERLENLENNISLILSQMRLNTQTLSSDMLRLSHKLEQQGITIGEYYSDIIRKLDPLHSNFMALISKEKVNSNKYNYPKCGSDLNTWRYDSLPAIATCFNLDTDDNNNRFIVEGDSQVKDAFSKINTPTSNLNISFDADVILSAREFVQMYDKCRKLTENVYVNDLENSKESVSINNDIIYTASAITAVNQVCNYGVKVIDTGIKGASSSYVVGAIGCVLSVCVCLAKILKSEVDSTADFFGMKGIRVKNRGLKLNRNTNLNNSVLSHRNDIVEKSLESAEARKFDGDILSFLSDDANFNQETLISAMMFNCRLFTVEALNSLACKSGYLVQRAEGVRNTPIYNYISKTNAKGSSPDNRLFLTYLRYYQQPYFGYTVLRDKAGVKDYIAGNTQKERKALFDCLQNAYFAAKMLLLCDSDVDLCDRKERWNWLNSYEWIGSSYYDSSNVRMRADYYHIEKFLKYMKICLCIQNLSPLCADKLLQMFCKYGKIDFKVDKNTDDNYSIY